MKKYGKKYKLALEKIDTKSVLNIEKAIENIKSLSLASFDETMEVHIKTNCNPKHADQIVRASIVLPNGTGKIKKVAVFSDDESKLDEAKKSGADVLGSESLIADVIKGEINFDIAVTTPSFMKNLAKVARILGPKGLMPSPKAGTVTDNVSQIVSELKNGKIEFKTDKNGIIHSVFGKKSFSNEKLLENFETLLTAIKEARPKGLKGSYIVNISISSTMSPGLFVEI
jgi:large subunit ribosomal protein L1